MTAGEYFPDRLESARPLLEGLLGAPLELQELKHKPRRRLTLRATGPEGRAIVKLYVSDRAPTVAARVGALAAGPAEPLVPRVLWADPAMRLVALSDLHGAPLRTFALADDQRACRRAGAALGAWHRYWSESPAPPELAWHSAHHEFELLQTHARTAPASIGRRAVALAAPLAGPWPCHTVVHRDLYEEQLLLGEQVALIDLDDVALGPPELDLGNLWAHLDLLGLRTGRSLASAASALLAAYGPHELDDELLERCWLLARLRLACIHDEPALLEGA
jgi:hypothetical protein